MDEVTVYLAFVIFIIIIITTGLLARNYRRAKKDIPDTLPEKGLKIFVDISTEAGRKEEIILSFILPNGYSNTVQPMTILNDKLILPQDKLVNWRVSYRPLEKRYSEIEKAVFLSMEKPDFELFFNDSSDSYKARFIQLQTGLNFKAFLEKKGVKTETTQ